MSTLRLALAAAVAVASGWIAAIGAAAPCHGQIRINEVLADPGIDWNGDGGVSSRDDEWVEIVNAGPAPEPLDGYLLSDGGTTRILRFGWTGTLGPGEIKVVYGATSVAWETSNGESAVGLSLNNAGDTVRLWRVVASDTVLVDSYAYAAFEVLDDRSTGRMPDGGTTWALFDALNPYTGTTPPLGTGCRPTPAETNGCPTAVERSTWASVKRLYDLPARPQPE
jgi:hypothetical protein